MVRSAAIDHDFVNSGIIDVLTKDEIVLYYFLVNVRDRTENYGVPKNNKKLISDLRVHLENIMVRKPCKCFLSALSAYSYLIAIHLHRFLRLSYVIEIPHPSFLLASTSLSDPFLCFFCAVLPPPSSSHFESLAKLFPHQMQRLETKIMFFTKLLCALFNILYGSLHRKVFGFLIDSVFPIPDFL
jgi:hypothetical protein